MKLALKIVLAIAVVYSLAVAGLYRIMRKPPEEFAASFAKLPRAAMMVLPFEPVWMRARAGELDTGDPAPDFKLPTLDKTGHVSLSSLRGRPVLLVFGSYT